MRWCGGAVAGVLGAAWVLTAVASPRLHAQQAASGAEIITRASNVYRGLSALRAEFVQVIDDPMIGELTSRGTLVQSGESKLSMRFADPKNDAIVIDGKHVWVYTPSSTPGQVIRLSLRVAPVYGYNLLGWLLDKPAERYRVTALRADQLDGRAMDVVDLTPTVPDLPFATATIWLDRTDRLPRRLELRERSGASRTLTLSRVQANPRVSAGLFTFDVPGGVRIVDQ